ncbi:MAG: exosortase-associated EpsI family protein, partial [Luteitalea sp.]|nr:exosortase-associated EpsI family protein [Luteitalea sp.]
YLTFPDWLRRCLLVAFGLGIAIVANPVRVALIGVFSHFGLSTDLHGPGHVFQGLFVAGVGYVALLCGVAVLTRWSRRPTVQPVSDVVAQALGPAEPVSEAVAQAFRPAHEVVEAGRPKGLRYALRYSHRYDVGAALAIGLLLSASAFQPSSLAARSDPADWLEKLPASIGTWQRVEKAGDRPRNAPRVYRNPLGQQVELRFAPVIRNYDTGRPAWWDRVMLQATPLSLDLAGAEVVTINRAHDAAGMRRIPVLYWYDVNGRVSSDRIAAKVHTMWHRFTGRGRLPVAVFVRPTGEGHSDQEVIGVATAFARDLVTALRAPLELQSAAVQTDSSRSPEGNPTAPGQ